MGVGGGGNILIGDGGCNIQGGAKETKGLIAGETTEAPNMYYFAPFSKAAKQKVSIHTAGEDGKRIITGSCCDALIHKPPLDPPLIQ